MSDETPCTCGHCGHSFAASHVGGHRVVVGDSTRLEDVEAALGARNAAVCLTDPPYGLGDSATAKNKYDQHVDSAENLDALIAGFLPLAREKAPVVALTPGNANHRKYPPPVWTMAWFTPAGTGTGPWGFCCWQPILCYGKDPKLRRGKGRHPDAIVHTEASEKNGHPCPKPVKLWSWLMERVSEPGDVILEPFLGSGTALIAAEISGRFVCAVELSPAYVDISIARWQAFTGKRAINAKTGEFFSK